MTDGDEPLVGREPELAALAELGPDRPLALTGEAGIGKTTLLRAAARRSGRRAFEGVGLASLSWMSYLPLMRALGEPPPRGDQANVAAWAASRLEDGILLLDDLQWVDADTLALLPLLVGPATVGLMADRDGVAPRHALLGEVAAAELDDETRRRLHLRIANLLRDPGEAARHLQAAGELEAARDKALAAAAAAGRPGERARHLAVAAACATGAEGDELRLQAADALIGVGDHELALERLAGVEGKASEVRARTALLRGRAHFWTGEMEAHRGDIAEGLALVGGTGSATEVRLRIEERRLPLWSWQEDHVPVLREVLALAEAADVEVVRVRVLLGIAHYFNHDRRCLEHLRAARGAALEQSDNELACEAAEFVCAVLQADGDPDAAHAEALTMQSWCRVHGLRTPESIFRWLASRVVCMSRGPTEAAVADLRVALADPGVGARADQIAADLATALAELGQVEEARESLDRNPPRTPAGEAASSFARAEVEWTAGRPLAAIEALGVLERPDQFAEDAAAAHAALGWSLLDLGRTMDSYRPARTWRLGAGAAAELEALACGLDPRSSARAERLFDEAAGLHAGQLVKWELRCRWGAAEAARRAGDVPRARRRLLALEERLEEHPQAPLLGRVRRSLRLAGLPRAEPRGRTAGAVTAREREVLELVAAGQSTAEIALRLGLSIATIESQIRSAMTKLGARTRLQAALLAAGKR